MVPDGMIKDDWTDSPDKDSDEDDANPHSTQVGQGYLHWNGQVKVICTTLQTTNNILYITCQMQVKFVLNLIPSCNSLSVSCHSHAFSKYQVISKIACMLLVNNRLSVKFLIIYFLWLPSIFWQLFTQGSVLHWALEQASTFLYTVDSVHRSRLSVSCFSFACSKWQKNITI